MIMILAMPALLVAANVFCVPAPTPRGSDSVVATAREHVQTLEELYRSGQTYEEFYAAAKSRRTLWDENTAMATVADDLVARARALDGPFHILAIAIDACSDSVNSIPYIAKLADMVDAIDLQIIGREAGRHLMESHRTPDGRAATPTLIVLNEKFEEVGCWIERPLALQQWYAAQGEDVEVSELTERKMEWYRNDGGREILREIVEILETAAAGGERCATNSSSS